ncbi:MAG: aspartate aminotransferase family protein [Candidatus Omnitrophota bacterium]|nr:MAG: aspartate aminotransferase family protein [Candidatus Omnitrophota bacterium]
MSSHATKNMFEKYTLPTYTRIGPIFTKGRGSWLWAKSGKRYLDLFPGWGTAILGHCHPRIAKTLSAQAKKLIHLPNNLYQEEQALLAKGIVERSYPAKVFFANSGAEAVEGAIKFSRLYGNGRYEIITMTNSFHGRTFGALSATGQKKYKQPFKPLLPRFKEVRFGDLESLLKKISKKTVGVMIELIQGEGGINVAKRHYIKKIQDLCQKNKLLLIIDEIQTGMGRTGKLFCYQHYGVTPDIMLLSKGLGAGLPISALVVKRKIADIMKPGLHASTFGGSPLVCSASQEAFTIIQEEKILNNVTGMSAYVFNQLERIKKQCHIIKEIRGMGLMVGIELACDSYPLFLECLKRQLIMNSTHQNVLRIMPALNVTREELDEGLHILKEVVDVFERRKSPSTRR